MYTIHSVDSYLRVEMEKKERPEDNKKTVDPKTEELLVIFANLIIDNIIKKYKLKGFKPNVVKEE